MRKFLKVIATIVLVVVAVVIIALSVFVPNIYLDVNSQAINFTDLKPIEINLAKLQVYIAGEVTNPGVYEVDPGARVQHVIDLAGGVTQEADAEFVNADLNLAGELADGQHIFIPSKTTRVASGAAEDSINKSGKVSINSGSVADLDSLPGIGPATAEKIIQARPFAALEDLMDVPGIGESKFNQIRDLVAL